VSRAPACRRAATDPRTRDAIGGVLGLGLPDLNELGWRWRDAWIYLSHGTPNEALFSTAGLAAKVAPLPLAAIHATRRVRALADVQRIVSAAHERSGCGSSTRRPPLQ
jgi:hypothetical protein